MKRFSVMVNPQFTDMEMELCQVESDPEPIVKAARLKNMPGTGGMIPRYSRVWLIDRGEKNAKEGALTG